MQAGRSRWLAVFVSVVFMASLAGLVYVGRNQLAAYQWRFRPVPALSAFGAFSLALWLAARVWASIATTLGNYASPAEHERIFVISNAVKRIPGPFWYIIGRAYLYRRHGFGLKYASVASAVELFVAIIGGMLVLLGFAPLVAGATTASALVTVAVLGAMLLAALVLPGTQRMVGQFVGGPVRVRPRQLVFWVLSYSLIWVLGGVVLFFILNTFASVPWQALGFITGAWVLVGVSSTLLVFLPSNFGVLEIGLGALLSTLVPTSVAFVLALLSRASLMVFEFVWALVVLGLEQRSEASDTLASPHPGGRTSGVED